MLLLLFELDVAVVLSSLSSSSSSRSITVGLPPFTLSVFAALLLFVAFADPAADAVVAVEEEVEEEEEEDVEGVEVEGLELLVVVVAVTTLTGTGGFANSGLAYWTVHSLAFESCFFLSLLYSEAISPTSGSFGFGSVKSDRLLFDLLLQKVDWSTQYCAASKRRDLNTLIQCKDELTCIR